MSEEIIKKDDQQGFLVGLLGDIPGFVRGILATMFGTTICLVAMLQLGGLQVPFTNWMTAQIAPQVRHLDESILKLGAVVSRIEKLEGISLETETRLRRLEVNGSDIENRVKRFERRFP